jgi:hypothetical protein
VSYFVRPKAQHHGVENMASNPARGYRSASTLAVCAILLLVALAISEAVSALCAAAQIELLTQRGSAPRFRRHKLKRETRATVCWGRSNFPYSSRR